MPPKKQAKPNGFVIFAQELQRGNGRKYNSLKEACDAAAPLWARMSKDQRKPYDDKARAIKGQMHPTRYTSEGIDVEFLTREEKLKSTAEEKARQEIRSIVTLAQQENSLDKKTFFVIHSNIFCYYSNADRYYPAEIAVLAFNLKDGVKPENIFYHMVHPGTLPIGYKSEAKQHSDETHLIPVPFDNDGDIDNNQEEIYYDLKAFLEKKKPDSTKRMPILFADKKHRKVIQRILDTWAEEFENKEEIFRVYSLQLMFYYLKNAAANDEVWPSPTFSDRELEKDVYAYVPEIACPFHANSARPLFCSKSIVLRYGYVLCDNCCSDLDIELIEGQHVPIHSAIPDSLSSHSSMSSRSSRSGRSSRRGFESDFDSDFSSEISDTESVVSHGSASTTISNLDDFPALGASRSNSTSNFSGSAQASSVKSYAGATGKSLLPDAFTRQMGELSLSAGRGSRPVSRLEIDSDASSISGFLSQSSTTSEPPRGRGRGFGMRNLNRPGTQVNK